MNFFILFKNIFKDKSKFLDSFYIVFLIILAFHLFSEINIYETISIAFVSYFSLIISLFIFDGFKLSDDSLIRKLQKFVFFLIIIFAILLALYAIDLNLINDVDDYKIDKDIINDYYINSSDEDKSKDHYEFKLPKKVVNDTLDILSKVASNIAPNIGAAAAAGTVGAQSLKLTSGLPATHRAIALAGSAFIGAAATTSGIKAGNTLADNTGTIMKAIEKSEHGNAFKDPDRLPSPDMIIIQSILENENNIPLFDLLDSIFTFNFLELLLILLLVWFWINTNLYRFSFKYFKDFINKYITPNSKFEFLKKFVNTGNTYNIKYTNILMVLMISLLITIKLVNLFFIGALIENIDDFITVYNHIKKNL